MFSRRHSRKSFSSSGLKASGSPVGVPFDRLYRCVGRVWSWMMKFLEKEQIGESLVSCPHFQCKCFCWVEDSKEKKRKPEEGHKGMSNYARFLCRVIRAQHDFCNGVIESIFWQESASFCLRANPSWTKGTGRAEGHVLFLFVST